MFEMLDPAVMRGWQAALAGALSSPSGLDDAGRVETIRALEELVCTATAAQAQLSAELDHSQRRAYEEAGLPAAQRGRGVAAQVALARRESHHRGRRHLGLARVVAAELPHTWAAWRAGRITEWTATVIARETACLTLEDRRQVDRLVAGDAARLERMGVREVAEACLREAARLDAAALVARRRRAEGERHVSLRPAPDAMTWLTALLPVRDGVAVLASLRRAADTARAAGENRSRGQVMADTLTAAVLADAASRDRAVTSWELLQQDASPTPGPGVQLGLVMTDTALRGHDDEPAHLEGHGAIPAELAREILAGACTREEEVWLRRLYTHPATGQLVAMDSRSRRFPTGLARFIRLRDRICRTPWCNAPIRHTDHVQGHDADGPTTALNGQGLCEACNHAKQAPGWRARPSPTSHAVETTTPTGHTYRSPPPFLARVHRRAVNVDYMLAG